MFKWDVLSQLKPAGRDESNHYNLSRLSAEVSTCTDKPLLQSCLLHEDFSFHCFHLNVKDRGKTDQFILYLEAATLL